MKQHFISDLKIKTIQSRVVAIFNIDGIEFLLVLFGNRDEEIPRVYPKDPELIQFLDDDFLEYFRMVLIEYYTRLPLPFYNLAYEKYKQNVELAKSKIDLLEYKKIIKTSYRLFI